MTPSMLAARPGPAWFAAAALAAGIFALGAPTSVLVAQVGIFASLALALVRPRWALQPLIRHPHLAGALAFYYLVQMASITFSQHPLRSLICLRGDWPVLYLPILLAVLQGSVARKTAWVAVLGAATLAGLVGLVQHFGGVDPLGKAVLEADGSGRFHAIGSLRGHLTYGGVMLVGLVGAFAWLLTGSGGRRAAMLAVAAACGLGLVMSYARSALLGGLAGMAAATIAALVRGRAAPDRRAFILRTAALITLGCAAVILLTPGLQSRLAGLSHAGTSPRVRLWGTALAIFADFPLCGAGLGSFKSHFPLYRLPGDYLATGHPHSDALNVLVHSGLAGLLAWAALWWTALRAATGTRNTRTVGMDQGVLAIGLVAAFLIAGLGQCYFTDEEPAAMLWLFLALCVSQRDAVDASTSPDPPNARGLEVRRRSWTSGLERAGKRALLPLAAALFLPRNRRAAPALPEAAAPAQPQATDPALPDAAAPAQRPGSGPRAARPRILTEARRILVVRQDNRLGNLVLMTPFLQALREAAPGARVGLLVGSRFAGVLAGAPWIDELLVMHKRALIRQPWSYPAHLASIRRGAWDLAIDLSNPDTHSFYNAFVPVVARARWRVGFDHPQSRSALNAVVAPPESECHYALAPLLLLSALGADPLPRPMRLSPALIERALARRVAGAGATASQPIVVHPGGRGAKQWPAEAFAALVRALAARRGSTVLVIGGSGEQALMGHLARELEGVEVRPISDLEGLVAALAGARLFVGCDAGPLHVAAALEVPVVALFLSSHPLRYAPLGDRHTTVVLGEGSRAWLQRAAARTPAPAGAVMDQTGAPPNLPGAVGGPPNPAGGVAGSLGLARGIAGSLRLEPAPDLVRMLAGVRPPLVVAQEGLSHAAQVDLVLSLAERALARAHSPLEPDADGAQDPGVAATRGRAGDPGVATPGGCVEDPA